MHSLGPCRLPTRLVGQLFAALIAAFATVGLTACGADPQAAAEKLLPAEQNAARPAYQPDYPFPVAQLTVGEGTDAVSIAYVDVADSTASDTTLLFVHGLGGELTHWAPLIDSLRKDYRCVALDLPGYGMSDRRFFPQAKDDVLAFYAETVLALANQLKLKKPVLVGHSMGGQTAIIAALQQPEAFSQLVLAAPAGFETFTTIEAMGIRTILSPELTFQKTPEQLEQDLKATFYQMPAYADRLLANRQALSQAQDYHIYCYLVTQGVNGMLGHPVRDELARLSLPTLVLFGRQDALIPNPVLHPDMTTQQIADIGQQIPAARITIIDDAGHLLPYEQPGPVADALRQFLRGQ